MELAQKQTQRSMEQERKPINEPTHLWSFISDKGGKNIQWRKRQSLQTVVLGKLDSYMLENEIRTFSTPHTKINRVFF